MVLDPTDDGSCESPNFGVVLPYKNLTLHQEPLLWPFIVIKYFDGYDVEGSGISRVVTPSGSEISRVVIPLFIYAECFGKEFSDINLKLAKAVMFDNSLQDLQPQKNPILTYLKVLQE